MPSMQKQIMDKIKYYRDQSKLYEVRGQIEKSFHALGRADGLEEAYKILLSTEGN